MNLSIVGGMMPTTRFLFAVLLLVVIRGRDGSVVTAFHPPPAVVSITKTSAPRGCGFGIRHHLERPKEVRGVVQLSMAERPKDDDDDDQTDASLATAASSSSFYSLVDRVTGFDVERVLANLQSGDLGSRGELYVAGQFALIGGILSGWPSIASSIAAPLLLLGGGAAIFLSLLDLGADSLTPFLPPTETGSLKTRGIYTLMRHPLYSGLVSAMAGISLLANSADRLILTVALYALVDAKAEIEEDYLKERYPDEYLAYMGEVPGRFLPTTEQLGRLFNL